MTIPRFRLVEKLGYQRRSGSALIVLKSGRNSLDRAVTFGALLTNLAERLFGYLDQATIYSSRYLPI